MQRRFVISAFLFPFVFVSPANCQDLDSHAQILQTNPYVEILDLKHVHVGTIEKIVRSSSEKLDIELLSLPVKDPSLTSPLKIKLGTFSLNEKTKVEKELNGVTETASNTALDVGCKVEVMTKQAGSMYFNREPALSIRILEQPNNTHSPKTIMFGGDCPAGQKGDP